MQKKTLIFFASALGISLGVAFALLKKKRFNPFGMTAAFLGDSQTAGFGWGWPESLSKKYGLVMKDRQLLAKGGQNTRWGKKTITDYLDKFKAPDILFVWFGGNDGYSVGISQEEFYKNLQEIVDTAKAKGVKHIYVISGFSTLRVTKPCNGKAVTDTHRKMFDRVESFKKGIAKNIKGARVIPMWMEPDNTWSTDCFHLPASAQAKFADWLGNQIFIKGEA